MSSTRKVPKRLGTAYRSPGADAAAVEVAGAAEAAEDVVAADADGAELAVCRGVLAASVKPDRFRLR